MMIPSIDIMGGRTVQLVNGKDLKLVAGDPLPIAEKFSRVGELAVVDLDAALGQGSNAQAIEKLVKCFPCRVSGGIRSIADAKRWLDLGAERIAVGTMATPEFLSQLPKQRVIAALDVRGDSVHVGGWTMPSGLSLMETFENIKDFVGSIHVTFIESEGMMTGLPLERIYELRRLMGSVNLTVAGGVRAASEIQGLDAVGIDVQVGMSLYTGGFALSDPIIEILSCASKCDLWPTVVIDQSGCVLGHVWSSAESIQRSIESGDAWYQSRKRGLWRKGSSSGNTQKVRRVWLDCDRDAIMFEVEQSGSGFCHTGDESCFGRLRGLSQVWRGMQSSASRDFSSYTRRLLADPNLLRSKLVEEAQELGQAYTRQEVLDEAVDVLYFTLSKIMSAGASFSDFEAAAAQRSLRVTRRGGEAKCRPI